MAEVLLAIFLVEEVLVGLVVEEVVVVVLEEVLAIRFVENHQAPACSP